MNLYRRRPGPIPVRSGGRLPPVRGTSAWPPSRTPPTSTPSTGRPIPPTANRPCPNA